MLDLNFDSLPLAKRFVWRIRDDVRKGQSANLTQFPGSFEQWWLLNGRSEYPAWASLNEEEIKWLSEPRGSLKIGTVAFQLPQSFSLLLQYRPDVVQKFTVEKKINTLALAGWFFSFGIREH